MKLLELFDSDHQLKKTLDHHDHINYQGTIGDRSIRMWFMALVGIRVWCCGFVCTDDEGDWTDDALGNQRDAFRVFSFVKKATQRFIKEYDPNLIEFDSDESHVKFYRSAIKRIDITGYEFIELPHRSWGRFAANFALRKIGPEIEI